MRRSADGQWLELTNAITGQPLTVRISAIQVCHRRTNCDGTYLGLDSVPEHVTESYEQIAALLLGPRPAGAATQAQMPAANIADD